MIGGWAGGYTNCAGQAIAQRSQLVNEVPAFVSGGGGAGSVNVANHSSMTIGPGEYTSITLGQGATLLLDEGTYTATSIYSGADATFAASNGDAGTVRVYVDGDIRFKNKNNDVAAMLYATGDAEFGPNCSYAGKCIANHIDLGGGVGNVYTKSSVSWLVCIDIKIAIQTDNFGGETTWTLSNCSGLVASGGPYTTFAPQLIEETIPCNNPNDCYAFTINDAAGDGICCFWGFGNYTITFGDDAPVSSPTGGAFGSSETINMGDCSNTCDIEVCIITTGLADEVSWELVDDGTGGTVMSGGGQNFGTLCKTAKACLGNGPYTFNFESQGFFNDNVGSFTIKCNGSLIGSGSYLGGQVHTLTALPCCAGSPKSDVPTLETPTVEEGAVFTTVNAYPNPFSGSTTISFTLSEQANVILEVYNTAGARVATLYNDVASEGYTSVVFDAQDLPVGVYMYRLTTNGDTNVGKLSIAR